MRIWKPRTIREQLSVGLVLIKIVSILIFVLLLIHQQRINLLTLSRKRVEYQVNSLAHQVKMAMEQNRPTLAMNAVDLAANAPNIDWTKVTDAEGNTLYSSFSQLESRQLTPVEQEQIKKLKGDSIVSYSILDPKEGRLYAGVRPVYADGSLKAYVWVYANASLEQQQRADLLRITAIFALVWISASLALSWALSQSITRPLSALMHGTHSIIHSPESLEGFPLPITSANEVADLTQAFNLMVASIREQRAGLRETLSLMDSMLTHAPIGFAFLDRRYRFVRVNDFFAEMLGNPGARFVGRSARELLPASAVQQLEAAIESVFTTGNPVVDMELSLKQESGAALHKDRSWLMRIYPVRSLAHGVSWVGVIAMDISERKLAEEAMRRTEKLAATGRMAASIAHEINNPLEAVTNLLYLLHIHPTLDADALQYVEQADHEVRRISEITEQTLLINRQSSHMTATNLSELMDSILNLNHGRQLAQNVEVRREFSSAENLICYSGEMRQVFANLVSNALDSMQCGGRLRVRIRRSSNWKIGDGGIRVIVADTGSGISPDVREHIFEAFFTTKEVTGTGLGLWISSEIILKHHGTIRVRSRVSGEGSGSGTVFMLFFPDGMDTKVEGNGDAVQDSSHHLANMGGAAPEIKEIPRRR